jgi:hypothetical protein
MHATVPETRTTTLTLETLVSAAVERCVPLIAETGSARKTSCFVRIMGGTVNDREEACCSETENPERQTKDSIRVLR